MPKPNYFTTFDECRADTLDNFKHRLLEIPKKRVGEVTLSDLCSFAEYPNGLYFFFDDDDRLWYVGKSTSRSFIERIPSHFDTRLRDYLQPKLNKISKQKAIGITLLSSYEA
jgi:hypothetical protein